MGEEFAAGLSGERGPVVLVSGGLDSAVLLSEFYAANETVLPVYVRFGLFWERAELHWLRRYLQRGRIRQKLAVLESSIRDLYGDHWSVTGREVPGYEAAASANGLPGRNILLLAKAVVFCQQRGCDRIALASLSDNPFPDATPEFFTAYSKMASRGLGMSLRIDAPFRMLTKAQVIRRGAKLPLELTFSCAAPIGWEHCGSCTKCAERQQGFSSAGLSDPTRYRTVPTQGLKSEA